MGERNDDSANATVPVHFSVGLACSARAGPRAFPQVVPLEIAIGRANLLHNYRNTFLLPTTHSCCQTGRIAQPELTKPCSGSSVTQLVETAQTAMIGVARLERVEAGK